MFEEKNVQNEGWLILSYCTAFYWARRYVQFKLNQFGTVHSYVTNQFRAGKMYIKWENPFLF